MNASKQIARLLNRIEVLERRNALLRAEVERQAHGEQLPWTKFEVANFGIFGDGQVIRHQDCTVYVNSRYQVSVFDMGDNTMAHLSSGSREANRLGEHFSGATGSLRGPGGLNGNAVFNRATKAQQSSDPRRGH